MELLRSESGPLRDLLEERGAWEPGGLGIGRRAMDYLRMLTGADRALVIHGNYLDEEEIAYLGRRGERMSVVYCPRTHAWFRHASYPLAKMLAEGVLVALGTDSRASAPDLDLPAEMRAAARAHPSVSPEAIVRMATWNGAKALGIDDELGTLEPGKWARLAIVPLTERDADPYELLMSG
jgi:cytosine/adenosine deaminase-related metal-dependent hydrolase